MARTFPRLTYDTDRLRKDISAKDVLERYLGVYPEHNGSMHCISPSHEDRHKSCVCKGEICHCFSCNSTWDIFAIVKLAHPTMSFSEICESICDSFGLDIYRYSNLTEVEKAKKAYSENKFVECFPVQNSDLEFIGLNDNRGRTEVTYMVYVSDYEKHYFGESSSDSKTHDENGKPLLMEVTRKEAAEMGYIEPLYDEETHRELRREYINTPCLSELWEKDKVYIENMIIDKAQEKADMLTSSIEALSEKIEQYRSSHSVEEIKTADTMRETCKKAFWEGRNVSLSNKQQQQIKDLDGYEKNKDERNRLYQDYERAMEISEKVKKRQLARIEYQKKKNKKFKGWRE